MYTKYRKYLLIPLQTEKVNVLYVDVITCYIV